MEPTERNLRAWDRAHRRDAETPPGLPRPVRRALGELNGRRVLHVGCGGGEATVELAELGGVVTGVDADAGLLESARGRAPSVVWVDAAPEALPTELRRGRFDLVYASAILARLRDVDAFARAAAAAVRPRGELLLYDEHPVALRLDTLMHWHDDYFAGPPRLGRVVTAVASAGFVIRALEEYPSVHGNRRRHDRRVPGEFLLYAAKET